MKADIMGFNIEAEGFDSPRLHQHNSMSCPIRPDFPVFCYFKGFDGGLSVSIEVWINILKITR